MRGLFLCSVAGLAAPFAPAVAADKLQFGSPPSWVVPQTIPAVATKAADAPAAILLSDQQARLQPGKSTSYVEVAIKLQSAEGLSSGNIAFPWQPEFDTVTVNKVHIIRGGRVIDVLASGQTFSVARRETNLDAATLDGSLTAVLHPEDLQVSDVVDYAVTIEHADPVMKNHTEGVFAVWNGLPVELAHSRITWPSGIKLATRETAGVPPVHLFSEGGLNVLEITGKALEPIVLPKTAPSRFRIGRLGEATNFASWAELADLFAPLYRSAAVIPASGPLRDELEAIRKNSTDPKSRAEKALELVENRVRCVALEMGTGGYVPASAETTWSHRFGDCKAKAVLLVGLLRELGLEAEPVLVNSHSGDMLPQRLPMVGLFNHAIVRTRIDGKIYWLDGTRTGETDLDRIEVPNFEWGLPMVARAALTEIVVPLRTTPDSEVTIDIDARNGLYAPAKISIEKTDRGNDALAFNLLYSQLPAADRDETLRREGKTFFDGLNVTAASERFDKMAGELHETIVGTATLEWKDGWYFVPAASIAYNPDFDRPAGPQHDAPFVNDYPSYSKHHVVVHLPPTAGLLPSEQKLPMPVKETLAGVEYVRTIMTSGDAITVDSSTRTIAREVAYKEALAAAPRLKALDKDDVYLRVPDQYRATEADVASLNAGTPASAHAYFVRAGALMAHNKDDDGIADLTAGLALDPKNVWALTKRAAAYVNKREFAQAERDLRTADAIEGGNSDVAAEWGELAGAQGDTTRALTSFDKALQLNPKNNWARLRRAGVLLYLGRNDDALREVDQVLAAAPQNVSALASRAELEASKEDWAAAERDAAAALAADPGDPTAYAAKAMIAVQRKDYRTALELTSRALERDPNNSFARNLKAQLLKREDHSGEANRLLDEAVARAPHDAVALLDRAQAYLQAKDYDAAEKDIAAVLAVEPADPRALEERGTVAMARGDYARAIDAFTTVIKAFPSNGPLLVQRAEAYRQMRRYTSAVADTDAALNTGLVSPSLRLLRINIRLQQGDLTAVAEEVEKLIKENPTSDFAFVVAGKTYSAIGMRQKAIESFDRALAMKPYAYIYINRAQARPYSDVTGKLADLDAALKLEPDQEAALAEKARLLSRQGKHADALELYDRAIKLALDASYLKLDRAVALAKAGRSAEAVAVFDAERAKSKTSADFNRLCWDQVTNDILLQSALKDCQQALRIDPDYWPANDSLGMVLLKLGKLKDALAAFDKGIAHQSGAAKDLRRRDVGCSGARVLARRGALVEHFVDQSERLGLVRLQELVAVHRLFDLL